MDWKRLALDASRRGQHVLHLLARPMTLGVRGLVIDGRRRVFLVRHTYVPGWHLPGGGVEPGETTLEALARELREEGNIDFDERPALHGIFFNRHASRRDHVVVYALRDFRQSAPRGGDWEIRETGFFPIDALPEEASRPTRDRLAEWAGAAPISERW